MRLTSSSNRYLILTLKILTTLFESGFSKLSSPITHRAEERRSSGYSFSRPTCHTVGPFTRVLLRRLMNIFVFFYIILSITHRFWILKKKKNRVKVFYFFLTKYKIVCLYI
ncbi:hypothetical protein V8G54_007574, partial [Vigna mungo]